MRMTVLNNYDRAGRRLIMDRDPSRASRLGMKRKKETVVF